MREDDALVSPCTAVCQIDEASSWCMGCGRSLREIAQWPTASVAQKRAILAGLSARLAHLAARKPA
jgi:predicted Fe-S protein YdhL (DUF1289 family)